MRDGSRFLAKILIGPKGTVQLAPGFYRVWVKVRHADNETPVIYAGRVEVE